MTSSERRSDKTMMLGVHPYLQNKTMATGAWLSPGATGLPEWSGANSSSGKCMDEPSWIQNDRGYFTKAQHTHCVGVHTWVDLKSKLPESSAGSGIY